MWAWRRFATLAAMAPPRPADPGDVIRAQVVLEEHDVAPDGSFAVVVRRAVERNGYVSHLWLVPLDEMHELLLRNGFRVRWRDDWSRSHRAVAESLVDAFVADATAIASVIGRRALDELLAAHRLWSTWLATGRVRKIALVAERL